MNTTRTTTAFLLALLFSSVESKRAAFLTSPQSNKMFKTAAHNVDWGIFHPLFSSSAASASFETTTPMNENGHPLTDNKMQQAEVKASVKSHKLGIFSPAVLLAKNLIGEAELNKLRGKVISIHSDVIGSFVDTASTPLGQSVLRALYTLADKNGSGRIEEEELAEALRFLGFDWLQETQIKGILTRADIDADGVIDLNEWIKEAPKTLRTNLVKLAKRNGGEMGLLA